MYSSKKEAGGWQHKEFDKGAEGEEGGEEQDWGD